MEKKRKTSIFHPQRIIYVVDRIMLNWGWGRGVKKRSPFANRSMVYGPDHRSENNPRSSGTKPTFLSSAYQKYAQLYGKPSSVLFFYSKIPCHSSFILDGSHGDLPHPTKVYHLGSNLDHSNDPWPNTRPYFLHLGFTA